MKLALICTLVVACCVMSTFAKKDEKSQVKGIDDKGKGKPVRAVLPEKSTLKKLEGEKASVDLLNREARQGFGGGRGRGGGYGGGRGRGGGYGGGRGRGGGYGGGRGGGYGGGRGRGGGYGGGRGRGGGYGGGRGRGGGYGGGRGRGGGF